MINNKNKVISFIFILIFSILIITSVSATNNTTCDIKQNNEISHKISHDNENHTNKEVVLKNMENTKENKKILDKKTTKNIKKAEERSVSSYEELYNTIKDIKKNSINNEETIKLNPGNYNITKTINWGSSKTTKILTINGNNIKLDGQGKYQFITVAKDYTLNLENIIINNCSAKNGAVIYNNGRVKIENSNFNSNEATTNGGVNYNNKGNISILSSNFTSNQAGEGGVNFNNQGTIIISDSVFSMNKVEPSYVGWSGGGVNLNNGTMEITNSNFTNNKAQYGGAIRNYQKGTLNIIYSNFINNNADYNGGAIDNSFGNTTIKFSNFTNNTGLNGGAICNDANLTIEDSNFTNNTANEKGGAVNFNGPNFGSLGLNKLIVRNSNFVKNNANYGGAISQILDSKEKSDTFSDIKSSNFTENTAQKYGGAVYVYFDGTKTDSPTKRVNIADCIMEDNYGQFSETIYSENNITLDKTTINTKLSVKLNTEAKLTSPIIINTLSSDEEVTFTAEGQQITVKKASDNTVSTTHTFITPGRKVVPIEYPSLPGNNINIIGIILKLDIQDKTITIPETRIESNVTINEVLFDENGVQLKGENTVDIIIDGTTVKTVTITDGVLNVEIPTDTLSKGEHTIKFDIKESDLYNPKELTSSVNIINHQATMEINTNSPVKVLGVLEIENIIKDEKGNLVKTGTVVYKLNGTTIATVNVVDGHADCTYQLKDSDKVGNYVLTAEFSADKYDDTTKDSNVEVQKLNIADKTITIPETRIESNVTINEVLFDENGVQLKGENTVDIIIDGTTAKTITIIDGVLDTEIPTSDLSSGEHTIKFNIKESDLYNPKELTSSVNIINHQADMTIVTNSPIKILETLEIKNTIVDENGNKVTTGTVVYKLNGTIIATVNVVDGRADCSYKLQPSDKAGNYTLTALFSADKYDDTTKDSDVVILKGDIADVIIPEATIQTFTNTTVDVQLNDTNGNPVYGNSTVDIIIDGKVVKDVTIVDGKLNITIPTDTQPAGEHNITIIIRENENYNNKTIDMKVTIIKRDVTIDIVKNDTKTLNILNVAVTVKDVNGNLVNGGKVGFKINGVTLMDADGNEIKLKVVNGIVKLSYQLPKTIGYGKYNLTAIYSNDKYYNSQRCTVNNLIIIRSDLEDITVNPVEIKTANNATFNFTIKDEYGNIIQKDIKIVVKLNNKTYIKTTTKDGVVSFTIDMQKAEAGSYTVSVIFDHNSLYNQQRCDITLNVVNRRVNVTIGDITNTTVMSDLNMNISVVEDDGTKIENGTVIFKINGKTIVDKDGNALKFDVVNGIAHLNYTLPQSMAAREYNNITAVYSNVGYDRAENTTSFTLTKHDIANLNITNITTDIKHNTTINITILDTQGMQLKGVNKVSIKVDGKTQVNATEIVDGNLYSILDTSNLKVGNHKIEVIVGPNSWYNQCRTTIPLIIEE